MNDDQAFLTTELAQARQSDDENAEKLVFLNYQQAVLNTLLHPELCEADAKRDLTLLSKRVEKLKTTTENYIATVAIIPMQRIQALFTESRTLLREVGQLCPACQQQIQQDILHRFRELRQPH